MTKQVFSENTSRIVKRRMTIFRYWKWIKAMLYLKNLYSIMALRIQLSVYFMKHDGITHALLSLYHPASNGVDERSEEMKTQEQELQRMSNLRMKPAPNFLLKGRIICILSWGIYLQNSLEKRGLRSHQRLFNQMCLQELNRYWWGRNQSGGQSNKPNMNVEPLPEMVVIQSKEWIINSKYVWRYKTYFEFKSMIKQSSGWFNACKGNKKTLKANY